MIYGKNKAGILIEAHPLLKENAFCPLCDSILIKKCGSIKIWHWAHKSLIDCDEWSEPETRWHLEWKKFFKDNGWDIEVPIEKHRADAVSKNRIVYEIQNSIISSEKIEERNEFYKGRNYKIGWIFNAKDWHFEFKRLKNSNTIFTFRWKWPHKSLYTLFSPYPTCFRIFFDLKDKVTVIERYEESFFINFVYKNMNIINKIFEVKKCFMNSDFVGGYGIFRDREEIAAS